LRGPVRYRPEFRDEMISYTETRRQAKGTALLLAAILAVAFALRVWGLTWGLPNEHHYHSYHPDEVLIVSSSLNVDPLHKGLEGLNPHFFNYGSAFIYVVAGLTSVASGYGWIDLSAGEAPQAFIEGAKIDLLGRCANVAFGVATVFLVYLLGRRLFGRTAGLIAAAALAVMPIHAAHCHYCTVDVSAAFWVTLCLLFAARAAESRATVTFALAGLTAGLAAATKYNMALVALAPILVALSGAGRPRTRALVALLIVAIGAVVGFTIGCPGWLIAPDEFSHGFGFELAHSQRGDEIFVGTPVGWWYHLAYSFPLGLGWLLFLASMAGTAFAIFRAGRNDWILLAWLLPFYALIGASQVKFMRYVLPLTPVLAILAARFLSDFLAWARRPGRIASGAVSAVVLLQAALCCISYCSLYAMEDPRDRAARWIEDEIPQGETIGLSDVPWFYTPPINPWNGGAKTEREFYLDAADWNWRFLITGFNPELVSLAVPEMAAFVTSDFETEHKLRLRQEGVERTLSILRDRFGEPRRFHNTPWARWANMKEPRWPHDWRYADPEILVYALERGARPAQGRP
jgi:hypothetical protein